MADTARWSPIEKRKVRGEFSLAENLNVRQDDLSGLENIETKDVRPTLAVGDR